ncbi:MAG: Stk1 family PASTA domain-containing Ser/Thr kinase, partial [Candidatus Xenobia bacterium]
TLRRFATEAKNAARMSHPNIVQVYDMEDDGDLHFLIMEYCDGGDVRQALQRAGGRLAPGEAVRITLDVLKALEYAHKHQIVHRDIKPHNILLTANEQVKLTDFGIAKALESDTRTQTGDFIGSVAYFSPEQAQGYPVTPASDFYALGVVLYELLTGRVPFEAENPVALAVKHVQEVPVLVRQLNPAVPPALEAVVMRALSKDSRARFASAAEFARALQAAMTGPANRKAQPQPPTMTAPAPPPRVYADPPVDDSPRTAQWIMLVLMLTVLGGVLVWAWIYANVLQVPSIIGKSENEARHLLESKGLKMVVEEMRYDPEHPPGTILDQRPASPMAAHVGDLVHVIISRGAQQIDLPNVVGMALDRAREEIESRGMHVHVTEANSDTVEEGLILGQDPGAGSAQVAGTTVTLTVSQGPQLVSVPDLAGMSQDQARQALTKAHLTMTVRDSRPDPKVPKGSVLSFQPGVGSRLRPNAPVEVMLSSGPPSYTVPDLVGMRYGEARAKADDAHFRFNLGSPSATDDDVVVAQDPPAGTTVPVAAVTVQVKASALPTEAPTVNAPDGAIVVPAVIGLTEDAATALLTQRGFTVGKSEARSSDRPLGTVVEQFPRAGDQVAPGTSVTLSVSNGVPPTTPEP